MGIATGFGVGYLPKAPGTWGSLLALPLHFMLIKLSQSNYFIALGVILLAAIIAAGAAEKIMDFKDPGVVVIDEVVGMLITLIGAPDKLFVWIIGFAVFRFFDIVKPFPIKLIDQHINGGVGIVMDDVLAGIYSLVVLQLLCQFMGW